MYNSNYNHNDINNNVYIDINKLNEPLSPFLSRVVKNMRFYFVEVFTSLILPDGSTDIRCKDRNTTSRYWKCVLSGVLNAVCKSDRGGGTPGWPLTFQPHTGATSLLVSVSPPPLCKRRPAAINHAEMCLCPSSLCCDTQKWNCGRQERVGGSWSWVWVCLIGWRAAIVEAYLRSGFKGFCFFFF